MAGVHAILGGPAFPLLEHIPDGALVADSTGRILSVNRQLLEIFGYEGPELLGQAVETLVPSARRDAHVRHVQDYQAAARPRPMGTPLELFGERRDGTKVPVDVSIAAVAHEGERYVVAIVRDCTVAYEKKEALLALTEEKNRFMGMAAHDLRNPLASVNGFAKLLLAGIYGELKLEQQAVLRRVLKSGEFMLQLVHDLLDVSKADTSAFTVRPRDFSVMELVTELAEIQRPVAAAKGIKLEIQLGQLPEAINMDSEKLEQILNNLISNAIKYSHSGTTTHVEVSCAERVLHLRVQDEGQGIPGDELPQLFEPFSEISTQPTAGESSTGLGLAIVKRIVDAYDGVLEVQSAPGHGTTFRVELPYVDCEDADAPVRDVA